jgi:hypothetical protein
VKKRLLLAFCWLLCRSGPRRSESNERQSFSARIAGTRKIDGFVPLYWDDRAGKMWMEISRFNEELLYVTALSAGVGSNELGLDRGNMSQPVIVQSSARGRA